MAATTLTTMFMILFALGVTALALYGWFGSWDAAVRTFAPQDPDDAEIEAAVDELRRAIRDYESGA
jgi:cytochrome c-type biogenesis protein CcmH/NrfG